MPILSHHGHNVIGDGLGVTLKACVYVTNLGEFKTRLVREVLGIGGFNIINTINLVSDPLCPRLRQADAGVGVDNLLYFFS